MADVDAAGGDDKKQARTRFHEPTERRKFVEGFRTLLNLQKDQYNFFGPACKEAHEQIPKRKAPAASEKKKKPSSVKKTKTLTDDDRKKIVSFLRANPELPQVEVFEKFQHIHKRTLANEIAFAIQKAYYRGRAEADGEGSGSESDSGDKDAKKRSRQSDDEGSSGGDAGSDE